MTTVLNLILLPLRAPMLLLLLLVSTYLGMHWSQPGAWADSNKTGVTDLIWSAECLQSLIVVVVCTVPDLLLRRLSTIMAASRVASLVITLLLVVTGGLYLLHLEVLSNVLILSSSVLLARLDLVRLRLVPPPFVMTLVLCVLVLGGISLGRGLELQLRPYVGSPQEVRAPESGGPGKESQDRSSAASPSRPTTVTGPETPGPRQPSGSLPGTPAMDSVPPSAESRGSDGLARARPHQARSQNEREPDRAIPHLQGSDAEPLAP